ncbi:glycosyltransferase [uncultured Oscillibacter sp.]|uniref:glycosyltransferase n=1 Tax=uncultured Oscillibacter sp. TaxID=876091 RepID=UPI002634074B|nr:glycosyltransferase [uncultured Oscillibacter sp.]
MMRPSKVLMVVGRVCPLADATSSIMYRVADELRGRYGVEIRFLGKMTREGAAGSYPTRYLKDEYRYYQTVSGELTNLEKLRRLALHPGCWPYRLRKELLRYPDWREYRRALRAALREEPDIDCVICSEHPPDTAYAAGRADLKVPLFVYKLDPWGTHYAWRGDPRYLREELLTDSRCAAVFVTPEIREAYRSGPYRMPEERVVPVDFPTLAPPEGTGRAAFAEEGAVHCAFVGRFYPDIRTPDFLFELFRRLEGTGIVLHIVGNSVHEERAYRPGLPSNIRLHGQVPTGEAAAFMNAADVLVSVGNSIDDQTPSKIVEYIARGKPILNICKLPNCPTLRYTEKYPLALNIQEADGLAPETVERVRAFCRDRRTLSFEQVRALYPECTPEYVGRQVYETLCRFLDRPRDGAPAETHRKGDTIV